MIILEMCPVCGHDLMVDVIPNFPSAKYKYCNFCGWSFEEEPDYREDDTDE